MNNCVNKYAAYQVGEALAMGVEHRLTLRYTLTGIIRQTGNDEAFMHDNGSINVRRIIPCDRQRP